MAAPILARMPTAEAFQSVTASRNLLRQKGVVTSLVVVIIFGIFLFYLLRPLRQASRQIHQMAAGDLPLEPLTVVRHDEVGEMVDGFNFLVAKVRAIRKPRRCCPTRSSPSSRSPT